MKEDIKKTVLAILIVMCFVLTVFAEDWFGLRIGIFFIPIAGFLLLLMYRKEIDGDD